MSVSLLCPSVPLVAETAASLMKIQPSTAHAIARSPVCASLWVFRATGTQWPRSQTCSYPTRLKTLRIDFVRQPQPWLTPALAPVACSGVSGASLYFLNPRIWAEPCEPPANSFLRSTYVCNHSTVSKSRRLCYQGGSERLYGAEVLHTCFCLREWLLQGRKGLHQFKLWDPNCQRLLPVGQSQACFQDSSWWVRIRWMKAYSARGWLLWGGLRTRRGLCQGTLRSFAGARCQQIQTSLGQTYQKCIWNSQSPLACTVWRSRHLRASPPT